MGKQFEGPTEAEAAIRACEALNISRSKLHYRVVDRQSGEPRRVVIETEDEVRDEPQPSHLAAEYDRLHGRRSHEEDAAPSGDERQPRDHQSVSARAPRREHGPGGDRGRRGGRGGGRGRNGRDGRGPRSQGRPRHGDDEEFRDTLAEEFKEFRDMTAAPSTPVAPKPALDETALGERAQKALAITRELLARAKLDARAQITIDSDEQVLVDLHGPDEGLIIGRKGETLLAMQFMVNRLLGKESEGPERVALDCEGYRERRQGALRVLAKKLGDKAKADGKIVTVTPMNAHDRRIFHITLDGQFGLKTRSEGDGLYRRVLIIPEGAEAPASEGR